MVDEWKLAFLPSEITRSVRLVDWLIMVSNIYVKCLDCSTERSAGVRS